MTHFAFELENLTDPEPSTGDGGILEQIKKLREKLKVPGFITRTAQDLAKMGAQAPDLDNIPEDPLPPAPGTQAPGGLDLVPPQAGVSLSPSVIRSKPINSRTWLICSSMAVILAVLFIVFPHCPIGGCVVVVVQLPNLD